MPPDPARWRRLRWPRLRGSGPGAASRNDRCSRPAKSWGGRDGRNRGTMEPGKSAMPRWTSPAVRFSLRFYFVSHTAPKKESLLLNLACNILVPTLVLTKLSTESRLGPVKGLLVALA